MDQDAPIAGDVGELAEEGPLLRQAQAIEIGILTQSNAFLADICCRI